MYAHDTRDLLELLALTELTEVEQRAERFIRAAGFTGFVYAFANRGDWRQTGWTPYMNGYGRRWIDRYVARGYAGIDPIPDYCFGKDRYAPLLWRYQSPAELTFAEDAMAYGIGAGVSFPIVTPAGRRGAFCFSLNSNNRDATEFITEQHGWMSLLASYVHDAYQRLSPIAVDGAPIEPSVPLSARELECLRWSADGKTAHEIAGLMGVTQRTVKFHLGNIRDKFGGLSARQVIARAIALRIIQP